MKRLSAIFVAGCMILIAGSAAVIAYFGFALSIVESVMIGMVTLSGLAVYNTVSTRVSDRGHHAQLAGLSQGVADLARQVGDLGRRVVAIEKTPRPAADDSTEITKPVLAEIGELGSLVKQLAETVASHDVVWQQFSARSPLDPMAADTAARDLNNASPDPSIMPEAGRPSAVEGHPSPSAIAGRFKGHSPEAIVSMITEAVDANRVEMFLQPIVTLPQRKIRFYEALSRLRIGEGEPLPAAEFLPIAEACGVLPKIDSYMLFRCVQVVRRLITKNRDVGMFLNMSASALADSELLPQITEFMDANQTIAPFIVFEFTQAAYRAMGPMERERLGILAGHGFRFSMDQVTDLRMEPRDLADCGFRFLKVPAALLLDKASAATADIHFADLSGMLSRFGIDLIAEKIETERTVVDLLDYDLKFGQGFLFAPPKPVRPEALQGITERATSVAMPNDSATTTEAVAADSAKPAPTTPSQPSRSFLKPQRPSAMAQIARAVISRA